MEDLDDEFHEPLVEAPTRVSPSKAPSGAAYKEASKQINVPYGPSTAYAVPEYDPTDASYTGMEHGSSWPRGGRTTTDRSVLLSRLDVWVSGIYTIVAALTIIQGFGIMLHFTLSSILLGLYLMAFGIGLILYDLKSVVYGVSIEVWFPFLGNYLGRGFIVMQQECRRLLVSPTVILHLAASVDHAGSLLLQVMSVYVVYSWLSLELRDDAATFSAIDVVGEGSLLSSVGHVASCLSLPLFIALYRSFKWQPMTYLGLCLGLGWLAFSWLLMGLTDSFSVMFFVRALGAGVCGVLASTITIAQEYHSGVEIKSLLRPHFGRVICALFVGLCAVADVAQDPSIHLSFMSLMALLALGTSFAVRYFSKTQAILREVEEKNSLLIESEPSPMQMSPLAPTSKSKALTTRLQAPRPHFKDIRALCPHYLYGKTERGHPIWIIQVGQMQLQAVQQAGFTSLCLKDHFAYMVSYIEHTSNSSPILVIIDLEGLKLIETQGWTIDWVCTIIKHLQREFEDTMHKAYVVNVPFWFSWVWKTIRANVDVDTLEKIVFLKSKLRKPINFEPLQLSVGLLSLLPTQYGGENPIALDEAVEELALNEHISSVNAAFENSREVVQGDSDDSDIEDAFFDCTPVDSLDEIEIDVDKPCRVNDEEYHALRILVAPPAHRDRIFVPLLSSTNVALHKALRVFFGHIFVHFAFDSLYPLWALNHPSLALSTPLVRLGLASLAMGVAAGVHLALRHVPLVSVDQMFAVQLAIFGTFPLLQLVESHLLRWPLVICLLLGKSVVEDGLTQFLWRLVHQAAIRDQSSESEDVAKVIERTLVWFWMLAQAFANFSIPLLFTGIHHIWFNNVRMALGLVYIVSGSLLAVVYFQIRGVPHCLRQRRAVETDFVLSSEVSTAVVESALTNVGKMQREELSEEQNPNLQLQQLQMQQQQLQQQQMQLHAFWQTQIQEISQIDPEVQDFKTHQLPLARIKKIMKSDEDVRMISAEAPVLFAKACEMFILELSLRAWIHTEENKRRTLQRNDIAMAITKTDTFDFLIDIVPREDIKLPGKKEGAMDPQMVYQQQLQQQQAAMLHQFMQSQASGNPAMWPPQQLQMMQHYQQQLQGMQPSGADATAQQQSTTGQQAQNGQNARSGVDV
ncbi:nuclear transcription factor Y subunit [Thraustotheca clavata]|uniref:Nuclear transcription factor Y subunit n=1 Tax=Thraustotheca clavata TaxID=74557 RepID=A0A1V9YSI2_9STRA|nr:nuclear transcription factor Y subunit [Thraustotheca clavata]